MCICRHLPPVGETGTVFDCHWGIGAGDGADCSAILMRPSVFLALVTPLPRPRPSLAWLEERIRAGSPLAPASLRVWIPAAIDGYPAVTGHDGRHRMTLLRDIAADAAVPVRILPAIRGYDAGERGLARMLNGMRAQRSGLPIPGPLFIPPADWDCGLFPAGVPPPPAPAGPFPWAVSAVRQPGGPRLFCHSRICAYRILRTPMLEGAMQSGNPGRAVPDIIQELGAAWRRHGPASDQFQKLMAEAIEHPEAADVLYQSCAAMGDEDGDRLANDMRRHLAEAINVFSLPDGSEHSFNTAIIAIPIIGAMPDLERAVADRTIMSEMRAAMSRRALFAPGSQVVLLGSLMSATDLAQISPDMLHAIRQALATVAFGGEDAEDEGLRWLDIAESMGRDCAADGEVQPGINLRFIVGVRATPISEYDPPLPDEEEMKVSLCVALDAWQEDVQSAVEHAGVDVTVIDPSHYDDAVVDGLVSYIHTMIGLEYHARHPYRELPETWDETHLFAWGGTLAVEVRHDGESFGPVGIPAGPVSGDLNEFTELLSSDCEEFICHDPRDLPSGGVVH